MFSCYQRRRGRGLVAIMDEAPADAAGEEIALVSEASFIHLQLPDVKVNLPFRRDMRWIQPGFNEDMSVSRFVWARRRY